MDGRDEQTLNMLKKLSSQEEHSLAFRCFMELRPLCCPMRVCAHPGIHNHENLCAVRDFPGASCMQPYLWMRLYPLFIVSLSIIIKRVFRARYRLERKGFQSSLSLCLGLIAASESAYVESAQHSSCGFCLQQARHLYYHRHVFLYELFKFHFISCRY